MVYVDYHFNCLVSYRNSTKIPGTKFMGWELYIIMFKVVSN